MIFSKEDGYFADFRSLCRLGKMSGDRMSLAPGDAGENEVLSMVDCRNIGPVL